MRRSRSRRAWTAAGLAAWLVTVPALADKTPRERALAETLFREAKSLVAAGKIGEACPKFAESQRLDPASGTLMYLATCHEAEGKTATAWTEFSEAVLMAGTAHQSEREKQAGKAARALEAKLSKVIVSVASPPPGVVVTIDGVALGGASLGLPLPFDPGPHVIEAKAPGKNVYTATVSLATGPSVSTVDIPVLADDAPAPAPTPPPAPAPEPAPPAAPTRSSNQATIGLGVGAVGIVSIGVGAFFGLRASSQARDADRFCTGQLCTPEGLSGHEDAHASALYSTVGFGVGIAALAAGAYLFFTAPKPKSTTVAAPKAVNHWMLAPTVARSGARSWGVGAAARW